LPPAGVTLLSGRRFRIHSDLVLHSLAVGSAVVVMLMLAAL